MRPNWSSVGLAFLPLFAFLLLWQAAYSYHWMPAWIIPSPANTTVAFWELLRTGNLVELIGTSARNALPPFLVAILAALVLGSIIGMVDLVRRILYPTLSALYPIPSMAWLTLIVLFVGFNQQAIWAVVFVSSFFKMIYSVIAGVRGVEQKWILAARNLGMRQHQVLLHVIIPGALPQCLTGVRMGFGSAWKSLIGAEMLVASFGGLGTFIWMAQWYFNFDKVLIGIIVIAAIGFFFEQVVFRSLEQYTLKRWGLLRDGASADR